MKHATLPRFSKATILDQLQSWATELESENGFKWGDGRAVVDNCTTDKKIAFGRYEAIRDIIEEIDTAR